MEKLARFGLVAQGISFGLVAVLAIELALGSGGKATDRRRAAGDRGQRRRAGLLSIVAAGLFAHGLFCVIQARYREV